MTAGLVLSALIMFLFVLPVFTGQVVNIGNVTGFLCGLFLFSLCNHPALIHKPWAIALCVLLAVCFFIGLYLTVRMIRVLKAQPQGHETLVILGCEIMGEKPSLMQVERLQAALGYLDRFPKTKVICSGGKGRKEKISEARAMKIWLMNHGIEEERIFEEDRSCTTFENILFSKKIIEENRLEKTIAVCTNEFHLYRALRIAESLSLEARVVPAATAWWLFLTFYVRELYAILWFEVRNTGKK